MSNDVSSKDDNRNNDNAISCSWKLTKRKNSIKNKYWTNKINHYKEHHKKEVVIVAIIIIIAYIL